MKLDVIVVGLGAVGSATLWQLARRGVKVLGIDRFSPPHAYGSSHGQTRITRQAIGEGEAYVPLVLRSHEIWRELEADGNEALFAQCGALIIGSAGGSLQVHGCEGFVQQTVKAAERFDIPHEILSPDEAMQRFPAFTLSGDELVYFEPGGGMVYPERCIAAQLRTAQHCGADLRLNERVVAIEQVGNAVRVTTESGVYEAAEAIVGVGAWSPGLSAGALADVTLYRQVLHWMAPKRPEWFSAEQMPVFIFSHGASAEDSFYGFPLVPGAEAEGVKVADENYTNRLDDPDALDRAVQPEEGNALHRDHLDGRLGGLWRTPLRSAVCLYSCTSDASFRVGRHPTADRILIASACSGHGFKHSAALGERIAAHLAEHASLGFTTGLRGPHPD